MASGVSRFAVRQVGGIVEMTLTGPWSAEARKAFTAENVDRLLLDPSIGYSEPSLDFLRGMPVRQLVVGDGSVADLEPLYTMSQTLTSLWLTTDMQVTLDLARLEKLRTLRASWEQVGESIGRAKALEHLHLSGYPAHDFTPLAPLRSLKELTIKNRPMLRSLHGLSELTALTALGVFGARSLTDITGLRGRRLLRALELEGCRRILDIADIEECTELQFLNLGDCGDIPTIAPIRRMMELDSLYLFESTRVLDRDLSPILGLPKLKDFRMQDRRGYRPSVAEIQRHLASRA